jgi:antitoxin MazE
MKANIIKIGNSQGIRIPKALLDQIHLGPEVDLRIEEEKLVITPISHPRQNWDGAFKVMSAKGDDRMVNGDLTHQSFWEKNEREW